MCEESEVLRPGQSVDLAVEVKSPFGTEASRLPDFESLLTSYHKRVYNLAYRLLGNQDEAADLAQETFIRAYKAYPDFRGTISTVYPWLCRIAVNCCKNRFRELNRRRRYEIDSLDICSDVDVSYIGETPTDPMNGPESLLQRSELRERVQEAIQALPAEYRVVIVLRDMQGLAYKEIVDITGFTLETVKSRLFRARMWLKRRLSAYVEE